ncbi:hypothetical protein B0H16DRAFT_1856778 [Mycena metata]|uniref:Uncharacterized protein n=1 Tax=Mycena metata TaxID=1033252 RepID=A0AAD7N4G5_9AGAR|nr:hypothetical protein B0H16DRAFT_1856778 [Mycena metata]
MTDSEIWAANEIYSTVEGRGKATGTLAALLDARKFVYTYEWISSNLAMESASHCSSRQRPPGRPICRSNLVRATMGPQRGMLQNKNAVHFRCALGLAMQNLLYFAATQWSRVYRRRAQEKVDARCQTNSHPLSSHFCLHIQRLRASVSFSWAPPLFERIAGPSNTPAHLASLQLAVNHRVDSVFESLGYGTACPLVHALILGIGLYHHPSFKRAALRLPNPAAGGILAPTRPSPHTPAPGRRFQNPRRIPRVLSPSSSSRRRTHLRWRQPPAPATLPPSTLEPYTFIDASLRKPYRY